VSFTQVAWGAYEEMRELTLDTRGVDSLTIENGAGTITVRGDASATQIQVEASIRVPGRNVDRAKKKLDNELELSLEKDSDEAILKAYFDHSGWGWGESPAVDLDIVVPARMHLTIDDNSGSLTVSDVRGDINVDDGSGEINMSNVGGNIDIDDGSGSIEIDGSGGNVAIDDGSGGIRVRGVEGSVIVDDGSGSIDVRDVKQDLIIVDDGSGGLTFSNIAGRVEKES